MVFGSPQPRCGKAVVAPMPLTWAKSVDLENAWPKKWQLVLAEVRTHYVSYKVRRARHLWCLRNRANAD